MSVNGVAATSGAAFAAAVNGSTTQKQVQASVAAEARAAKMSQDISEMAGTLIEKTMEEMSQMQASMGIDILV